MCTLMGSPCSVTATGRLRAGRVRVSWVNRSRRPSTSLGRCSGRSGSPRARVGGHSASEPVKPRTPPDDLVRRRGPGAPARSVSPLSRACPDTSCYAITEHRQSVGIRRLNQAAEATSVSSALATMTRLDRRAVALSETPARFVVEGARTRVVRSLGVGCDGTGEG